MKINLITFCLFCVAFAKATNYLQSELYGCIKCLCHARSGCWFRSNCARYSITKEYWTKAGSIKVHPEDPDHTDETYKKCIRNENCIVGTILGMLNNTGKIDCNCDGVFDCKDFFAIHMSKGECSSSMYDEIYAKRYNHCAADAGTSPMVPDTVPCIPEAQ